MKKLLGIVALGFILTGCQSGGVTGKMSYGMEESPLWFMTATAQDINYYYDSHSTSNLCVKWQERYPGTKSSERIRSEITEAAIYKHFPSKRKIFEELVVFFEESIFSRINGIKEETKADEFPGQLISLILKFCEMNKGFSRILTREVFTVDEAKISDKVSNCFEKISVEIRQSLQDYERTTKKKLNLNLSSTCDLLISCLEGQIQSFVRSRFKKDLSSEWQEQWIFLKKSIYPS